MLVDNFINQLDATSYINSSYHLKCHLGKTVQSIFNSALALIVMHPKGQLAGRYLLGPLRTYQACSFLKHTKNKYNALPYLTALQGISGIFSKQVADHLQIPVKITLIHASYQKNGQIHIKHAIDAIFVTIFCLSKSSNRITQVALVANSLYLILILCCVEKNRRNSGYAPTAEVTTRRACLATRIALGLRQAYLTRST